MYCARACILAIYADHPAAIKCTNVGKACIQCFTPEAVMDLPPYNIIMASRTDKTNKRMAESLCNLRDSGMVGARDRANKRARKIGVNLLVTNPFAIEAGNGEFLFGPDPEKYCIYQSVPQPVLHGMDEDLTAKLARGVVEMAIAEGERFGHDATDVRLSICRS